MKALPADEDIWRPHVTVATVVPRDGRFLLVEEDIRGRLVLNQPAGHLDPDEAMPARGRARDARRNRLGHRARLPPLRAAVAQRRIRAAVRALHVRRRAAAPSRDARARRRHRAHALADAATRSPPKPRACAARWCSRASTTGSPAIAFRSTRSAGCRRTRRRPDFDDVAVGHRRHVGRRRLVGRGAAAAARRTCRVAGMFMQNWEEDDRQRHVPRRRRPQGRARRLRAARHSAPHAQLRGRILGPGVRAFPRRIPRRAARRIRTCCATARSSSRRFLDHARALGAEHIATGHYARVDASTAAGDCCAHATAPRTRAISCTRCSRTRCRRRCFRSASSSRPTCARSRAKRTCRRTPRRTRPASASSASATSASSSADYMPGAAGRDPHARGRDRRRARGRLLLHARPAQRPRHRRPRGRRRRSVVRRRQGCRAQRADRRAGQRERRGCSRRGSSRTH